MVGKLYNRQILYADGTGAGSNVFWLKGYDQAWYITPNSPDVCQKNGGYHYDKRSCAGVTCPACTSCNQCTGQCSPKGCVSPIVIDIMNEGIHLTSFKDGVPFDFAGNGQKMLLSWTDSRYHNAWLALDRNHNGTIDNVQEMFGIPTQPQLAGTEPSGWAALRIYDTPAYGGNGDGFIDPGDKIYSDLLLWIDENHDGISQPNELHHLAEMGVHRIKLQYKSDCFLHRSIRK